MKIQLKLCEEHYLVLPGSPWPPYGEKKERKKERKKKRREGMGEKGGGDEEKATESSTEDSRQFLLRIYLRSKKK